MGKILLELISTIKINIPGSECQPSGIDAQRAKQATKKTKPWLACVF
jgi:hypothetical protein